MNNSKLSNGSGRKLSSLLNKPLHRLPAIYVKDCGYVPIVLTNAACIIEKNIKTKDIFQTQGITSKVNGILAYLNAGRVSKVKNPNVHDVIEAVKLFLIRLPSPVLPESVCDALISASKGEEPCKSYGDILAQYKQKSPQNVAILNFMIRLLKKVSDNSEFNLVDTRKLATIFVLDIIKPLKLGDPGGVDFLAERMKRLPYLIIVIESLISNLDYLTPSAPVRRQLKIANGSPSIKSTAQGSPSKLHGGSANSLASGKNEHEPGFTHQPKVSADNQPTLSYCTSSSPRFIENGHGDEEVKVKFPTPQSDYLYSHKVNESKGPAGGDMKNCRFKEPVENEKLCEVTQTKDIKEVKNNRTKKESMTPITSQKKLLKLKKAVKTSPNRLRQSKSPDKKVKAKVDTGLGRRKQSGSRERTETLWSRAKQGRKRKSRARSCGKRVQENETSKLRASASNQSQYSAFLPDEDITPWNDAAANSDDPSIMTNTIKNPRVLPAFPSRELKLTVVKPYSQYEPYQPYQEVNFGIKISGKMKKSHVPNMLQAASEQATHAFSRVNSHQNLSTFSPSGLSSESSTSSIHPATAQGRECKSWAICHYKNSVQDKPGFNFRRPRSCETAFNPGFSRQFLQGVTKITSSLKSETVDKELCKQLVLSPVSAVCRTRPIRQLASLKKAGLSPVALWKDQNGSPRFRRLSPTYPMRHNKQFQRNVPSYQHQKESEKSPGISTITWSKGDHAPNLKQNLGVVPAFQRKDKAFKLLQRKFNRRAREMPEAQFRQCKHRDTSALLLDIIVFVVIFSCFVIFFYTSVFKSSIMT